ncbi:30S ribosomal protein S27ae [Candidatus Woesearchaeota archaeon]|nr:30S ribosomal protein S27ae [Candidatus Woesearchaeota archaeon]
MAKKKIKNKIPSKVWEKYKVEGNKLTKAKNCPKCGPGYFLADMKDRFYCGHCHYLETKKKE